MCEFGGHLTQIELEAEQNRQSIKESGSSGSYANHSSREPLEKRTGFARFPRLNSIRMYSAISPDGVMVFSAIPDSFPESYRKDCKCLFRDIVDIKEVRVRERAIAATLKCNDPKFIEYYPEFDGDCSESVGYGCLCVNCVAYRELTKTCRSIIDPKETEKKAGVENAGASMD